MFNFWLLPFKEVQYWDIFNGHVVQRGRYGLPHNKEQGYKAPALQFPWCATVPFSKRILKLSWPEIKYVNLAQHINIEMFPFWKVRMFEQSWINTFPTLCSIKRRWYFYYWNKWQNISFS